MLQYSLCPRYNSGSVKRQETGYLLGPASTRSEAIPERNLSPLTCAVMRFILHACFMWSACHQTEVREGIVIANANIITLDYQKSYSACYEPTLISLY